MLLDLSDTQFAQRVNFEEELKDDTEALAQQKQEDTEFPCCSWSLGSVSSLGSSSAGKSQ